MFRPWSWQQIAVNLQQYTGDNHASSGNFVLEVMILKNGQWVSQGNISVAATTGAQTGVIDINTSGIAYGDELKVLLRWTGCGSGISCNPSGSASSGQQWENDLQINSVTLQSKLSRAVQYEYAQGATNGSLQLLVDNFVDGGTTQLFQVSYCTAAGSCAPSVLVKGIVRGSQLFVPVDFQKDTSNSIYTKFTVRAVGGTTGAAMTFSSAALDLKKSLDFKVLGVMDLGIIQKIDQVILDFFDADGRVHKGFRVEVSTNGTTWTRVSTAADQTREVSGEVTVNFALQNVRYIRISAGDGKKTIGSGAFGYVVDTNTTLIERVSVHNTQAEPVIVETSSWNEDVYYDNVRVQGNLLYSIQKKPGANYARNPGDYTITGVTYYNTAVAAAGNASLDTSLTEWLTALLPSGYSNPAVNQYGQLVAGTLSFPGAGISRAEFLAGPHATRAGANGTTNVVQSIEGAAASEQSGWNYVNGAAQATTNGSSFLLFTILDRLSGVVITR